jgi:glycerol-3-phosphate dehydrogenase
MAAGERILFAIPWGERVILGTTDTDYDGPLDEPTCEDADTDYILEVVNQTFPRAALTREDVISTWAGLRPLVADPNGNPSDISRRHEISMSQPGWWDVTGGKLTTYRLMAEETVNAICKRGGDGRTKSRTAHQPLLEQHPLDNLSGILPPPIAESTVQHYCRNEWARHLDDVMARRTSWRHYRADHVEVAIRTAGWMARELGWDRQTELAEIAQYRHRVGANGVAAPHAISGNGQADGHDPQRIPAVQLTGGTKKY